MNFREKSQIVRKRALSVDNEYSLIIRKIKKALMQLQIDSTIFGYKEIRVLREKLWEIKKNYIKFLTPSDVENIKEIEKFLVKLKISHPHLCSKESYQSFMTNTLSQSTIGDVNDKQQKGSGNLNDISKIQKITVVKPSVCDKSKSIPMELDESLMSYNNKKPEAPIQEDINMKEKKPLVASQQIRSAEGFDEKSLDPIQKLYLQALDLWECIEQHEAEKNGTEPPKSYPYLFN